MKTIWKFPLAIADEQEIKLPRGAVPLSVGYQDDDLMMWALVDTRQPARLSRVRIMGTGNPADVDGFAYVGTAQTPTDWEARFVWHVWVER